MFDFSYFDLGVTSRDLSDFSYFDLGVTSRDLSVALTVFGILL